jgi:hypothetical protein
MTVTELTTDDLLAELGVLFVDDEDGEELLAAAVRNVNRWIERGDGVAIYENHDLGHPHLGDKRFISFGSSAAQLEIPREELPERLPDGIGGDINWRYLLVAVYTGSETL